MSGRASLLVYGTDRRLLDTRRMVLASVGHEVSVVSDPLSLEASLSESPFNLLILCHSLPSDEDRRVAAMAPVRWPWLTTLSLDRGSSSHPEALLAGVAKALAKPVRLPFPVGKAHDASLSTESPKPFRQL